MIHLFFDVIIMINIVLLLTKFRWGLLMLICSNILIPYHVRFIIGPLNVAMYDILSLFVFLGLIINYRNVKENMPKRLQYYFLGECLGTFVLILLSSGLVPLDYQLFSFFKLKLLEEVIFLIAAYHCLVFFDKRKFCNVLLYSSFAAGIYGIIAYFLGANPWIYLISISYTGEADVFSFFLEEVRGGIAGRAYGTMTHPLAWGQFWGLLVPFSLLMKKYVNNKLLIAITFIGVANCYLCGSRTALITLFVALAISFFAMNLKKQLLYIIITVIAVFTIGGSASKSFQQSDSYRYIMSAVFFWDDTYTKNAEISGSSSSMRQNQLDESIRIASMNPIGGVGYNYQFYSLNNDRVSNSELMGFESIIFKKLVEQGFLGLVLFIYILFLINKETLKYAADRQQRMLLLAFSLSYITSIVFTGISGYSWTLYIVFMFVVYGEYLNQHSLNNNKIDYDS